MLDGDGARRALLAYTGDEELARLLDEPRLLIQPEPGLGDRLSYRLVWSVTYRLPHRIETWEGRVDAHTGQVVTFEDTNKYAQVVGGVYPRTVFEQNETTAPMPFVDVSADGSIVTGDQAGSYAYSGGPVAVGLNGRWFDTNCQGCTNPPQPQALTDVGAGFIDFGLGGDDEVGNGFSTPSDRNTFYHLNQIRRLALKWTTFGFLNQTSFTSNVNISSTCNAVYTGDAVNFYRSGGGCNNTGEVADVVYHEYGHGVDLNTNGGDGATGEGTADVVSMMLTRSPLIGPGFRTDGDPVRNVDKNTSSLGLLTRGNIATRCSPGPNNGPLGYQVHCEGQIYGQTSWTLAEALVAKHGAHTGWREHERIFFLSLPDAQSQLHDGSQPIYDAYIQADDDDGNLLNGTPNGQEIFDSFSLHEIAGTPRTSSPTCTRPAQPALSVTPQCDGFDLSWNAVAGVDHYEIFRTELIEDQGYFPVAEVPAGQTTFTDNEVAAGIDYWYVVMAVDATGCESTVESPVAAALPPQPILSVSAAIGDDEPRGNRSGFADPGEEVDLLVTLRNFGTDSASSIAGSIVSPTAGVTLLDASSDWPDLASGGLGENMDVLRFQTDDQMLGCGDLVRFQLVPGDSSGCAADTSYFDVVLGERVAEVADAFEADTGWQADAVNSTAATGLWVRGAPEATGYQAGEDHTPTGTDCWYTGANPGNGDGTDDIDDGEVILLSPVYDLSSLDAAEVSYYRWFAMSEASTDSGDYFTAEVSENGGLDWVELETLDFNSPAPGWNQVRFQLDALIALTSQVQFRFRAADGTFDGSIVEAAIDDFSIDRFVCDDTPACFDEPTFAGLDVAAPGGSCAEVDLSWQDATSNCINAVVTYNVYRSLDPGFTPGPENLVVEGLASPGFTDVLLDPGEDYHYVVRAFDSRSGEDSNAIVRTATAPDSPDDGPPVFGGLASAISGDDCSEVQLDWAAALETCNRPVAYDVYRSSDPLFTPAPENLVASTFSTSFVDAGVTPGDDQTYVVVARDAAGNTDGNLVRVTATPAALDLSVFQTSFEPDDAGWTVTAPNDATAGNWAWGDPAQTSYQSGDDATPLGVNAWITGLAAGPGNDDVDGGTTTLLSTRYNVASLVSPTVRYARWFTNDQGGSPGDPTDSFRIDVSNDDGQSWSPLEEVGAGTPLEWISVALPLPIPATSQVRFRFTAADLGDGSLVEAGIDEFEIIDVGQGCNACGINPPDICNIQVGRSGDDIVVDWGVDPGVRVLVYQVTGCDERILVGTVEGSTFVHENAALSTESFNYRVTFIDACGAEVPFCGQTDCP